MDINKLLAGIECSCKKVHTCDIKYVYIEENATARLEDICLKYNNILIVADENTFGAAGEKTAAALHGKNINEVIFSGKEILVPNEETVSNVEGSLENAILYAKDLKDRYTVLWVNYDLFGDTAI